MPTETERKFLLKDDSWRNAVISRTLLRQAYARFEGSPNLIFRVRLSGDQAFLTLKGPASGCSRAEFEYPVPVSDAEAILEQFCTGGTVEKYRCRVPAGKHIWEIDEFLGQNAGLTVAELELESPDETFEIPAWLGREVTGEIRFYNSRLLKHPYSKWTPEEKS